MKKNYFLVLSLIFLITNNLCGQERTSLSNRHQKKLCRNEFVVDSALFKDDTVYYDCGFSSEQIALYLDNKYLSVVRKKYKKFCVEKDGGNYQIYLFELRSKYQGIAISEEFFLTTPSPNYFAKIEALSQTLIMVVGYVEQFGANHTVSSEAVEKIRWIMQQMENGMPF